MLIILYFFLLQPKWIAIVDILLKALLLGVKEANDFCFVIKAPPKFVFLCHYIYHIRPYKLKYVTYLVGTLVEKIFHTDFCDFFCRTYEYIYCLVFNITYSYYNVMHIRMYVRWPFLCHFFFRGICFLHIMCEIRYINNVVLAWSSIFIITF